MYCFSVYLQNFVPKKFLSKGIFSFSKIKFYLCFLRSSKGITHTSIKYSNKYSKLKQSDNFIKFYFYYNFYFYDMLLNIFFGQDKHHHPQKYPLTRYVDKLNTNKLLIPSVKILCFLKNIMILKGMFNVCNCTIFLLKF